MHSSNSKTHLTNDFLISFELKFTQGKNFTFVIRQLHVYLSLLLRELLHDDVSERPTCRGLFGHEESKGVLVFFRDFLHMFEGINQERVTALSYMITKMYKTTMRGK